MANTYKCSNHNKQNPLPIQTHEKPPLPNIPHYQNPNKNHPHAFTRFHKPKTHQKYNIIMLKPKQKLKKNQNSTYRSRMRKTPKTLVKSFKESFQSRILIPNVVWKPPTVIPSDWQTRKCKNMLENTVQWPPNSRNASALNHDSSRLSDRREPMPAMPA